MGNNVPFQIALDLARSSLTWEDVSAYGWYVIDTTEPGAFEDLKHILGFTSYNGHDILRACTSILVIPYPLSNFSRVRLYPPLGDVKYLQPRGVTPAPYILAPIAEIKGKSHRPVIITEGEKKTLCLIKHGFNAIGLPGVWCFKNTKQNLPLLKELDRWNWKGRTLYICFDSDAIYNIQVLRAEIELGLNLYAKGAKVFIVRLPQPSHKTKYGVDDYITEKGIEAFRKIYKKASPIHKAWPVEYADEVLRIASRLEMDKSQMVLLYGLLKKTWGMTKGSFFTLLNAQEQKGPTEDWAEEEREEALELLKDPALLNRFIADTNTLYVGRERERILAKLVMVGRKITDNKEGTGLIIQGSSSVGKSALIKSILMTVWPGDVEEFTRMSANFLCYRNKPLTRKILTIFELSGGDDASIALRTGLSETKLKIGTVDKNRQGQLTVRENEIDATGMVLISTTTRTKIEFELGTRVISINLEHDENLARKVYELAIAKQDDEKIKKRFRIWQVADALLEPRGVVVPYAKKIAATFPTDQERYLRDFNKVIYLIKASAFFHQYQRDRDENGNIVATPEDYQIVYDLQHLLFEVVFDKRLKDFIHAISELAGIAKAVTKKDLQDNLKLSKATVNRRIAKACQQGLIEVEGKGAKAIVRVIGEPEILYPLPKPKNIFSNLGEPMSQMGKTIENTNKILTQPHLSQNEPMSQINQNGSTAQSGSNPLEPKLCSNDVENLKMAQRLTRNIKKENYEEDDEDGFLIPF